MTNNRNDTNFLRFLAIVLIVNSHLDRFYPIKIFATGGMIGNSLFFMLSSFGLYLSWEKRKYSFRDWYVRRISRIYPSVWIIVFLIMVPVLTHFGSLLIDNIFVGKVNINSFGELVIYLLTTPYWFLQALMIYYVFVYIILKYYSQKMIFCTAFILLILYGVWYTFFIDLQVFSIEDPPFKLVFYFMVVIWGLILGSIKDKIKYSGMTDFFILIVCAGCIYLHKFFMFKGMLSTFQLVQHIAIFPLLYYFLKIAKSHFVINGIMNNIFMMKTINFVSKITLEIYIVHSSISILFKNMNLAFPVNVAAFIFTSSVIAILVYYLSICIGRVFDKIIISKNMRMNLR